MISMKIQLSDKEIETIAEELDCGFKCFYNLQTKEVKCIMDPNEAYDLMDEMKEEMAEIEENWDDYFEFEKMDSKFSFLIMEGFVEEVPDESFRNRLISALSRPKPFRNFKFEIDNKGDYRQNWFDFKRQKMIDWVRGQIQAFNSGNS